MFIVRLNFSFKHADIGNEQKKEDLKKKTQRKILTNNFSAKYFLDHSQYTGAPWVPQRARCSSFSCKGSGVETLDPEAHVKEQQETNREKKKRKKMSLIILSNLTEFTKMVSSRCVQFVKIPVEI